MLWDSETCFFVFGNCRCRIRKPEILGSVTGERIRKLCSRFGNQDSEIGIREAGFGNQDSETDNRKPGLIILTKILEVGTSFRQLKLGSWDLTPGSMKSYSETQQSYSEAGIRKPGLRLYGRRVSNYTTINLTAWLRQTTSR